MEPISNSNRTLPDPTPEELEAAASLPRPAETLESRRTDAPAPPQPAVQSLVDRHPPSVSAPPAPPQATAATPKSSAHPGVALGVGGNLAIGPGIAVGVEASIGVAVDLSEGKISVFTSASWGTALAPGVSAGVAGQASGMKDVSKFWGSGAEVGVDLPVGGASINYSTPAPGGARELNGATLSLGPSVGGDGHYLEGTTTERWSMSLHDIKDALKRAMDPTDSICVDP